MKKLKLKYYDFRFEMKKKNVDAKSGVFRLNLN